MREVMCVWAVWAAVWAGSWSVAVATKGEEVRTAVALSVVKERLSCLPSVVDTEDKKIRVDVASSVARERLSCLPSVVDTEGEEIRVDVAFSVTKERLSCLSTKIPLHHNRRVQGFINYFTEKDRPYTRRILADRKRYFPIFEYYLAKYGLPDELKYLAVVESGLRPDAVSRMGAAGLWQFMPSTGRLYGLRQNAYVDERYDPYKATEAACRYLRDLYRQFRDWELALSAFNSGPGRVSRAIRRSGKRKFWKMYRYLPRETRSYLPQFVAIVYVMNYYPQHRLFPSQNFYMAKSDTVHLKGGIGLRHLAQSLSLCEEDFLRLNSVYRWAVLPNESHTYVLRIPSHKKTELKAQKKLLLKETRAKSVPTLAKAKKKIGKGTIGKKRIRHKVRRGEALSIIARRYGLRVSDIKKWNRLRSSRIYAGQRLKLWVRKGHRSLKPSSRKKSSHRPTRYTSKNTSGGYYIVQSGDTLWSIAKSSSTSVGQLKRLNKLHSNRIQPGQRLMLSSK